MAENTNENVRVITLTPENSDFYGIDGRFFRMDPEVAATISEGVHGLANRPAGGRIRFCTDTVSFFVRAEVSFDREVGFDLYYLDEEQNEERYAAGLRSDAFITKGTFQTRTVKLAGKPRTYTLNLPYNAVVKKVEIGIDEGASFGHGARYRNELPVVFYGSSITGGAWACRPGNAYIPMLSRLWNLNYLNFGFAGKAKGEPAMAEYLAKIPMCAFVLDYDHNAPNPEFLEATHRPFYEIVRAANPDIPILILSRPDVLSNPPDAAARAKVVRATYEAALARGDNVAFIDGHEFFRGDYAHDCTRDGCHPNDLGFYRMTTVIAPVLARMLGLPVRPYDLWSGVKQ